MQERIFVTGSAGVIGHALCMTLKAEGAEVVGFDVRSSGSAAGDVRDPGAVTRATRECTGIVHLAAVSRVVWGEQDPETCWDTNVRGTRSVVAAAMERRTRPWLLFASSREVYGQPDTLPVTEDMPLRPMNVYGRSKAEGEAIVREGAARGLRAAILRFSNVYGSPADHADRVVPAFVRAAIAGARLRVDGSDGTFDFVHIDDTVRGILAAVRRLADGAESPPPIHLTTGTPTTLGELARLATSLVSSTATIEEAPARSYDVARFLGDPSRARATLGWAPRVSLREGLARLIEDLRSTSASTAPEGSAP